MFAEVSCRQLKFSLPKVHICMADPVSSSEELILLFTVMCIQSLESTAQGLVWSCQREVCVSNTPCTWFPSECNSSQVPFSRCFRLEPLSASVPDPEPTIPTPIPHTCLPFLLADLPDNFILGSGWFFPP